MSSPKPIARVRRRTRDERSALEQQAVAATLKLFAEGGYEAVSMRRLAAEVGVAPMSLYRYFPSKSHLLRHIWQDILDRACTRAAGEAARSRTARSRLATFVGGYVNYWLDAREHYHVVFGGNGQPLDAESVEPRPDLGRITAALTGCVAACIDGDRSPAQAKGLAEEVHWLVLGFLADVIAIDAVTPGDALAAKARLIHAVTSRVARSPADATAEAPRARVRRAAG